MCGFLKCLQCFGADRYWNTKIGSAWALPESGSGSTKEIVEMKNFNSMCYNAATDICTRYRGKSEEGILNFFWERRQGKLFGGGIVQNGFYKIKKTFPGRKIGRST